jgi:hypothetical protein|tara:strand:+ start:7213 stop:7458 length:246 start_codon:yes stop_codon:yes gene_type:complete
MQNVYEQFFYLKYSGGWSFSEAYNLPIGLREWFVERLSKQLQMENDATKESRNSSSSGQSQTLTPLNQPTPPPGFESPDKG